MLISHIFSACLFTLSFLYALIYNTCSHLPMLCIVRVHCESFQLNHACVCCCVVVQLLKLISMYEKELEMFSEENKTLEKGARRKDVHVRDDLAAIIADYETNLIEKQEQITQMQVIVVSCIFSAVCTRQT